MKRVFRGPAERATSADVEKEIALHIELRAREFEAAGMSAEDARHAAIDAFGDRASIENEMKHLRGETVRGRLRRDRVAELRQDAVVGARMLRRSPGFTIVALLTLAIGIGANTAIFSVLRSVLLRPLPYPNPEQLVQVWTDHRALGRATPEWLTPPDYLDWRDRNRTFSGMAAYQGWGPDLTGVGDPESLTGLTVTGNFFDVLGVTPGAGRLFTMADDDAGAERVIVLSDAFWRRRFGADPSVLGKKLSLSGVEWTVVGVLPATFHPPVQAIGPSVYRPLRRPPDSPCGRGCIVMRAIGRLKPGVSITAAHGDLSSIAAAIAKEFPRTNEKVGVWLIPLHEQITGKTKPALVALSAAVGFVLLLCCVNLANLLLVRGAARGREIGVRTALGAGRGRVMRQLLTENALLAVLGGAMGVVVGIIGSRVLGSLVPDAVRQVQEIRVDATVLAFAAAITVVAAAVFGLIPAFHTVSGAALSLRGGRSDVGPRASALRNGLVVTQLTLAVMLLISAGLLLRSFVEMQRVDLGYRADGVYLTGVAFPAARYQNADRILGAINDLATRLRANPAVKRVAITDNPPLGGGGDQDIGVKPVGEAPRSDWPPSIWYRAVSPEYLDVMHMRLVKGRQFTDEDRRGGPPVGIVNEEAARRYWAGKDPVGRVLSTGDDPDAPQVTVVGVVASARHDGPGQPYKPELFVPLPQFPSRGVALVLEPSRDLIALTGALKQALHEVDPLVPVSAPEPIDHRVSESVALPRVYATLVGVFAAIAMFLAALGVYGVMSYAVAQRQREIGVRLALGAEPGAIRSMVLAQGGRLAALGLVVGIGGALLTGRLLARLLFGISRFDPQTFVAVPVVLGIATLVACWIPARRAMRMDPLVAIREE